MTEPVVLQRTRVRLDYTIVASATLSRFLRGLKAGKLLARRDPATLRVYCPPREGSPTHGTDMGEFLEVSDQGTLTTFCIVNVAFESQIMQVPYVYGAVLLDGTDTPFLHLIDVPALEARMGLRVKAEWKPASEREGSFTDIRYFRATGELDAPYERYQEYL